MNTTLPNNLRWDRIMHVAKRPRAGDHRAGGRDARAHLSAIMQKLDAHSRIEAIRVAGERGCL